MATSTSLHHRGFTAEVDIDPETTLLRGRITKTSTVFYAKYNHLLESRFKAIVENGWWDDGIINGKAH